MPNLKISRAPMILGAADGVVILLGLLLSLAPHHPDAIFHAALGVGLAELIGMASALWLSDGPSGLVPAIACGVAACVACIIPALPYLAMTGTGALLTSLLLVVAVAAVISWLRPEKGVRAVAQTYGVLVVAAVLCTAVSEI